MNRRNFLALPIVGLFSPKAEGRLPVQYIDFLAPEPYVPSEVDGIEGLMKFRTKNMSDWQEVKLFHRCINDFARAVVRTYDDVEEMHLSLHDMINPLMSWKKIDGIWRDTRVWSNEPASFMNQT